MNKKLNIAELLKDCPKGMELDCTCADNVVFDKIIEYEQIKCVIGESREPLILDKYGRLLLCCPKCVIFPKGKTTWEGFQRPFKDGDVVFYDDNIAIFKEWGDETLFRTYVTKYLCCDSLIDKNVPLFGKYIRKKTRLATEEEKQKLFQAIKDNGYKWNPETKTLEKLPKFKVGDRVKLNNSRLIYTITDLLKDRYRATVDSRDLYEIEFERQDAYKLVPNKFDITTLKPFERVLVRDCNEDKWKINFFGYYRDDGAYQCMTFTKNQCIPYESNKHLLGTTNDCDDYFKTWE